MKRAAVGFRVRSGWAALVALASGEGPPKNGARKSGEPAILVRRRIHLVKNFTYEYRQPYHTASKLSSDEGRALIAYVKRESRELAVRAIRELQSELREHGFSLERCGLLLASGRPLPALPKILAAHSLIHTADGKLFREAILHAANRCGLQTLTVKERDLLDSASRAFHRPTAALARRLSALGAGLGPPWSQDEKFALLVAWLAVSSSVTLPRAASSFASSSLATRAQEVR